MWRRRGLIEVRLRESIGKRHEEAHENGTSELDAEEASAEAEREDEMGAGSEDL